jgi:ligand-binding sensor domain-containing protein
MPRVKPKGEERLVVSIDDGLIVTPDGGEHVVRAGQRLYASRSVVRAAPSMFVSADLDDIDIAEARRARLVAAGVTERS